MRKVESSDDRAPEVRAFVRRAERSRAADAAVRGGLAPLADRGGPQGRAPAAPPHAHDELLSWEAEGGDSLSDSETHF